MIGLRSGGVSLGVRMASYCSILAFNYKRTPRWRAGWAITRGRHSLPIERYSSLRRNSRRLGGLAAHHRRHLRRQQFNRLRHFGVG